VAEDPSTREQHTGRITEVWATGVDRRRDPGTFPAHSRVPDGSRRRAPTCCIDAALWLRLSAHAYNEADDYEHLAEIVACVLHEGASE
jgi:hypothetical protein